LRKTPILSKIAENYDRNIDPGRTACCLREDDDDKDVAPVDDDGGGCRGDSAERLVEDVHLEPISCIIFGRNLPTNVNFVKCKFSKLNIIFFGSDKFKYFAGS
jgi:hypothetical protein